MNAMTSVLFIGSSSSSWNFRPPSQPSRTAEGRVVITQRLSGKATMSCLSHCRVCDRRSSGTSSTPSMSSSTLPWVSFPVTQPRASLRPVRPGAT